jgi:hypothetical protein
LIGQDGGPDTGGTLKIYPEDTYGQLLVSISNSTVIDTKSKDFDWSGRRPGHGRDPEDLRRVAVQGRALQDPPPLGAGHRRTGRPGDAREVRHQQRSVIGLLFMG